MIVDDTSFVPVLMAFRGIDYLCVCLNDPEL